MRGFYFLECSSFLLCSFLIGQRYNSFLICQYFFKYFFKLFFTGTKKPPPGSGSGKNRRSELPGDATPGVNLKGSGWANYIHRDYHCPCAYLTSLVNRICKAVRQYLPFAVTNRAALVRNGLQNPPNGLVFLIFHFFCHNEIMFLTQHPSQRRLNVALHGCHSYTELKR